MQNSQPLLNSILLVEERLAEAKYFCQQLARQRNQLQFSHNLNAFLSAARSVTFMLQKVMAKVPGFSEWWAEQQAVLAADKSARFFLNLRNFSQKAGRVSVVGSSNKISGRRSWSYRFAGNQDPVPLELLQRDVVDCCNEHISKLAKITLHCAEKFPYHTCPTRALTEEGLKALGLSLTDLDRALGLGEGWIAAGSNSLSPQELLRILRSRVDGVNFEYLTKLSKFRSRKSSLANRGKSDLSNELLERLVAQLEGVSKTVSIPELLGEVILSHSKN